jgi:hypothetical protein
MIGLGHNARLLVSLNSLRLSLHQVQVFELLAKILLIAHKTLDLLSLFLLKIRIHNVSPSLEVLFV